MLRARDIVALVCALILTRMAWNDSTESLSASASLAFYLPREKATVISPMDVDGDGTSEALAIIKHSPQSANWVLQILDLKPLHQFTKTMTHAAPFQPKILFSSPGLNEESAIPIKLTSGQVLIQKRHGSTSGEKKQTTSYTGDTQIDDRNRHFFCGLDWHDASSKCGTPCPAGQASECPDDERCFADTPCDLLEQKSKEDMQVLFQLTPGGGLPSLITLWSNGIMTMHSLTSDKSGKGSDLSSKPQRSFEKKQLELKEMWHTLILSEMTTPENIVWIESNLLFMDAYESEEAGADHGMIVVSGSYMDESKEDKEEKSFLIAVDAMKGTMLWESLPNKQNKEETLPLPIVPRSTSNARRRSRIPGLQHDSPTAVVESLPNCLVTLKQHLKEVLPYSYYGPNDASLAVLHLDLTSKRNRRFSGSGGEKTHGAAKPGLHVSPKQKWHHHYHKPKKGAVLYGRPNVLVTKNKGGLQLRSLKNGRALCHLSLLEESLYSDLNNDGIMDQVQVLLDLKKMDPKDQWVSGLVSRLQHNSNEQNAKGSQKKFFNTNNNLCHAMALSGLPAKEELFSTSLCGMAHERVGDHPTVALDSVAPIVVENLSGRRNTRDVVVALNNGMVHRLHGASGRREWSTTGRHYEDFPTWEQGSQNALLTRIQSSQVVPSIRPVLLAGENGLAVLSVKNGRVLASAPFPQTSIFPPVLAEVSGDGTTDVMILSADGIWGFQIQVRPGSPVFLRIAVGLLLMTLMLAFLQNRFGQKKDKRATDE